VSLSPSGVVIEQNSVMNKEINNKTLRILILWMLIFGAVEVFFLNVITMDNYLIAIPYFLTIILMVVTFNKTIFRIVTRETKTDKYLLLIIPLILHGLIYWVCVKYLREPTELIRNNSVSFLSLNKFYLWVKPLHVLLQQMMIIVLVKKLHQNNVSLREIMVFTAILFGATHIYPFLVGSMTLPIASYFTGFAVAGSIIFPHQILMVKNGYLNNIIMHTMFYSLSALLFWSLYG